MKITALNATAFMTALLFTSPAVIAGEETERDEYSIGVVWLVDDASSTSMDRVNYSIAQPFEDASALDKELFPEPEGR